MVSKREISCGGGSSLWKITMSKNGKSTISMGHGFNSYVTNYQRVKNVNPIGLAQEKPIVFLPGNGDFDNKYLRKAQTKARICKETGAPWLTGAKSVGLLDGLLGVAGMKKMIVSQWIIPENSLKKSSNWSSGFLSGSIDNRGKHGVQILVSGSSESLCWLTQKRSIYFSSINHPEIDFG